MNLVEMCLGGWLANLTWNRLWLVSLTFVAFGGDLHHIFSPLVSIPLAVGRRQGYGGMYNHLERGEGSVQLVARFEALDEQSSRVEQSNANFLRIYIYIFLGGSLEESSNGSRFVTEHSKVPFFRSLQCKSPWGVSQQRIVNLSARCCNLWFWGGFIFLN